MPIFLKLILHKTKIQYIITIDFVDSTQSKTLRKRSALFVFIYSYMAFTHRRTIWQIFNSEPEDKKARRDCRGCISPATPRTLKSFFETIVKEILDRQDCAVFYPEPGTQPEDVEDYELRLKEMQLFVVPVTTKLLTQKNRAMDVDVPFAFENRIPVLPLMQESGLDDIFNKKFGDLQYLDKNNSDPTAIPYEEKLTKYLDAIIVGDKLAKKVRAAFDAYIFLSYRKKDRRYAQELMRLIHQNDFCRDIAIWYDEFLTPGEDFNDAIKAALEKSGLFALAVTPNLINEINYILNIEYPMAQEMGKNILPAEMEPTDREKLREMYPDIPDVVVRSDKQTLCDRLMTSLKGLAIAENDNDPQHNFFIGLAYLGGIDVEVNHERAVNLITGSAEQGYIPAIEKLVSMYNSGEGVSRDYHKAVEWQKNLAEQRKRAYETNPNASNAEKLLSELWDLGIADLSLRQPSLAKNAFDEMRRFSEQCSQQYKSERFSRYQSASYNCLGMLALEQEMLSEAEEWIRKCLALSKAIAEKTGTVEARSDLANCYHYMGDIAKAHGLLRQTEEWYQKRFEICEALAEETGTAEARSDLANCCLFLGKIAKKQNKLRKAEEWIRKCLALSKAIAEETGTVEARRYLSVSNDTLGEIAQARGMLSEAEEWYQKGLEIYEAIAKETETIYARQNLSVSYTNLGSLANAQGRLLKAEEWFQKSLVIREALAEESETIQARRDLFISYHNMGVVTEAQGKLSDAEEWYRKSLAMAENNAEESEVLQARRDLSVSYDILGDIAKAQGKLSDAEKCYRKSLALHEALAEETGTVQARRNLSVSYSSLSDVAEAQGRLSDAEGWLRKALALRKKLSDETHSILCTDDLAACCSNLGYLTKDKAMLEQALGIWEHLAELYPENPRYRECAEIVKKAIQVLFPHSD